MTIDWEYCNKYTDKFRNDASCGHSFNDVYEPYLENSTRILEIGTQQGGFIKFCKDQIPDVYYVGAELYPYPYWMENNWVDTNSFNEMADKFFVGNAFEEPFIYWIKNNNLEKSFDLVIEDGPHTVDTQVWMIKRAETLLSDKGVYICEDIESAEAAEKILAASPFPEYTRIWNNSEKTGRFDDICVIIDRRRA
jgi:hypothetical protein